MYILIIWSYLCTAADPGCLTGDFKELGPYEFKSQCMKARRAWKASDKHNGAVCYWSGK